MLFPAATEGTKGPAMEVTEAPPPLPELLKLIEAVSGSAVVIVGVLRVLD